MRSTLRSLTFGLAGMLALGAMAQYPFTLIVSGTMTPCTPGTMVTLVTYQGTDPAYNMQVPLDSNCHYSVTLGLNSSTAYFGVSASCGGGLAANNGGQAGFNSFLDSASVVLDLVCNGGTDSDGDGIPDSVDNCPNTPGVIGDPCDDGNANTINDMINQSCICAGDTGGGTWDCLQVWNGPNMPGTACNDGNPGTYNDVWSANCVCAGIDTSGGTWDCLQIWNGPNMPGTPCVNFMGDTGVWSVQCVCQTNSNPYDCTGVLNGPNMPGTACDDGNANTTNDTWNLSCICVGDTAGGFIYDCNQVLNGPDMPGTPCTIPGTTIQGTWSANCVCEENNPAPCDANFWVLQAWAGDSNNVDPIPYELWIWNLSSGGSGVYTYLWDFGDGSSSTEAFPTHTYSGNGPYNLCLTINDGNGCLDTYCDEVSVDDNGIYTGMIGEGNRSDGFTINVQNQLTGVSEVSANNELAAWPNPVVDELNLAVVSDLRGVVNVTITDLNGRVVLNEQHILSGGKSQLHLSTNELGAGLYMVRIGNNETSISQRFVKTR